MLNAKKIISVALALSMAAATPVVCAAEMPTEIAQNVYSKGSERSINWTYISVVGAGFSIDRDYGKCIGSYELYSDMESIITVSLMKSKDGKNWSTVESWDDTNYNYSPSSMNKTSTNPLQHGNYYCTYTQVQVINSNGKAVETAGVFSNSKYYP